MHMCLINTIVLLFINFLGESIRNMSYTVHIDIIRIGLRSSTASHCKDDYGAGS